MKKPYKILQINIKSFHPFYINRFIVLCKKLLNILKINVLKEQQIFLPRKKERFTLLRSPHVDKKARDQFERVTYKRVYFFKIVGIENKQIFLKLFRMLENLANISIGVNVDIKYQQKSR